MATLIEPGDVTDAGGLVVLVDDAGTPVGSMPKQDVHTVDTPLHLAFSCYLFNDAGELLVTRRALTKATWAGVWTNSVCGHPRPGEATEDAVIRHARDELGADIRDLREVLPDFRYRATDASGIVENEICPVFAAQVVGDLTPAIDEVAEYAWAPVGDVFEAARLAPFAFSPWMREQIPLLTARGSFAPTTDGGAS